VFSPPLPEASASPGADDGRPAPSRVAEPAAEPGSEFESS
jgi:hypothetical protein